MSSELRKYLITGHGGRDLFDQGHPGLLDEVLAAAPAGRRLVHPRPVWEMIAHHLEVGADFTQESFSRAVWDLADLGQLLEEVKEARGVSGRRLRRLVQRWLSAQAGSRNLGKLAIEHKVRPSGDWTLADIVRVFHPRPCPDVDFEEQLYAHAVGQPIPTRDLLPVSTEGQPLFNHLRLQELNSEPEKVIAKGGTTFRMLPRRLRNDPWCAAACLPAMSLQEILEDLPQLRRLGIFSPEIVETLAERFTSHEVATLRPAEVFAALNSDLLPDHLTAIIAPAYGRAMRNVVPIGRSILVIVNTSGVMSAGLPDEPLRWASAYINQLATTEPAVDLQTLKATAEADYVPGGYVPELAHLNDADCVTARDYYELLWHYPGTEMSLQQPLADLTADRRSYDAIIVLTDGPERITPTVVEKMARYRRDVNGDAKLVVVNLRRWTPSQVPHFILEVGDFTAVTPDLIHHYIRGV